MESKERTGLDAIMPVVPEIGANTWDIIGWKTEYDGQGDEQIVILLKGGYKTSKMRPNAFLRCLSHFEQEHPQIMFKSANGGQIYKSPIKAVFNYLGNAQGRRFKPAYENIRFSLEQPTAQGGKPSKSEELTAFV